MAQPISRRSVASSIPPNQAIDSRWMPPMIGYGSPPSRIATLRSVLYIQSRIAGSGIDLLYESDEAAAEHDRGPEQQRHGPRELGCDWRRIGPDCPAVQREVEHEGNHQNHHLELKRRIDMVSVGVGREHQRPGDGADAAPREGPAMEMGGRLGGLLPPHAESEKAKVYDRDRANR